ncbi:metallophosphoesterase [Paenibacillus filicis]|uniref:Metallophosphoesterase n=1 Tax=Paenibacillus filicis TaxID=669464 RepID=A0ABU9DH95_9BACL
MRIVILGDFHLKPEDYGLTQAAMEDIAASRPDLIIPLGDFGSQGKIGRIEGLEEAERFLRYPAVPLRPILGNHDLECESGNGEQPKGTIETRFLDMFGLDKPYGVLEYEQVRFFFASTEPQSPDSCYDVQEVFATDEQFDWLKSKLQERPGVPVIFFTHAPPVGSGLRTVPRVHVRSTNAYLDENHDPYRWYELFKHTPEIVMWFSAHYHLSHIHPDSHTYRFGTHFFITGVHGAGFTRDGMRQSRILDIGEQGIRVRTLDHIKREVTEEGSWSHDGPPPALIGKTEVALSRKYALSVGEAPAMARGLVPLSADRCLVSTEDGFTWEAEPRVEAVFGTVHIGPALAGLAVTGERIWMAWGNHVGCSSARDPWRFVRDANGPWPTVSSGLTEEVSAIAVHPEDGVWAAVGAALWKIRAADESGKLSAEQVADLPEPSLALIADGRSLWSLSGTGILYVYSEQERAFAAGRTGILTWDAWRGYAAGLTRENGQLKLISLDGQREFKLLLPDLASGTDAAGLQVVCLGGHQALVLADGQVFFIVAKEHSVTRLEIAEGQAVSISRSYPARGEEVCGSFYVGLNAANRDSRPKLELWEKE